MVDLADQQVTLKVKVLPFREDRNDDLQKRQHTVVVYKREVVRSLSAFSALIVCSDRLNCTAR